MSVLVLAVTGYGWSQYRGLVDGVYRSGALGGQAGTSTGGATNILIMGLDSRLDENGNPLPPEIYDALHAGDQQDGGYNANVLMLVHLPGNGAKATAISIPRDDYVALAGSPDGTSQGKIKQAYGLAFDQEHKKLLSQGVTDPSALEQRSRDAGRTSEINTVGEFLGGVPIDHFVEVTLVAFYQIAQVVAPITVCVNEDTQDSYSGALFHQGYQQIDAAQAVAFVRQRRDTIHPELNFTDLDRERRQQAFIAALGHQLKKAGTITNPTRLRAILDVATQNIAVDNGLDLAALAGQASSLTGGNITFTTLPIDHFGKDSLGEDVNIVDPAQVHTVVRGLLDATTPGAPPASSTPAPATATAGRTTVEVVNATARPGLAATVARALGPAGYTPGATSNTARRQTTTVYYPPGGAAAAAALARILGVTQTVPDPTLAPAHLRVVLGTGFTPPPALPGASDLSPPAPPGTTQGPAQDPTTSTLTDAISGGAIPCVK